MTRKTSQKILSAAFIAAFFILIASAARAADTGGAAISEEAPVAATAPATIQAPRLPTPEEIAERLERRYADTTSYFSTFTLWRPDHGKKLDNEKLKKNWDFERKRVEKYTLWLRVGKGESKGNGHLPHHLRLLAVRGPLKGTEVYYNPAIKEPRATVLRSEKVMRLNSGDLRLKDIARADVRAFASELAARLRDPKMSRKIQRENEGGNIIVTSKPVPFYEGAQSSKTTRWTVSLARDGALKKMVVEEKLIAPPGMMDALKSMLGALLGFRHAPPKPKFNIMHIYNWGEFVENPPLPEDHFIYNKNKGR